MKVNLKKIKGLITGRYNHLKIGVQQHHEWYGNPYGGFYLIPKLLNRNSVVYSFGIGEDISFDDALIQKYQCQVVGFDPTPKSIRWCQQQLLPNRFSFKDYGLAAESGMATFYLPANPNYVSGSLVGHDDVSATNAIEVPMKSLPDIVLELGHPLIDVLKMDIEGAEYEVIPSILESGIGIDQLVIEFHERFFTDGKEKTSRIIRQLKDHGFEIFAVSDSFEEVSFVRVAALNKH
jgi:FkbM family methyltransferase